MEQPLFGPVFIFPEDIQDFFFHFSLNDDLSVFYRSADSAFVF